MTTDRGRAPAIAPRDVAAALRSGERLLGLDVGSKTIGLALSDAGLMLATPLRTIRRSGFAADAAALARIVADRSVGGLIVGLPVNMNGEEGRRCQSVRQFADDLLARLDLPLVFWDERLSTAAVTRVLLEAQVSRRRRGQVVDKMAAAYILQGLLDHLRAAAP